MVDGASAVVIFYRLVPIIPPISRSEPQPVSAEYRITRGHYGYYNSVPKHLLVLLRAADIILACSKDSRLFPRLWPCRTTSGQRGGAFVAAASIMARGEGYLLRSVREGKVGRQLCGQQLRSLREGG